MATKKFNPLSLIGVAVLLLLFSSCTTFKKASRYFDRNEREAIYYCSTNFPIVDSIVPGDTIYIPALNEDYGELIDSIFKLKRSLRDASDSAAIVDDLVATLEENNIAYMKQQELIDKLKKAYKPCKPDTIHIKGETVYRPDPYKLKSAQLDLQDEKIAHSKTVDKLTKMTEKRNWWRQACLITWGIILIAIIFWYFDRRLSILKGLKNIVK